MVSPAARVNPASREELRELLAGRRRSLEADAVREGSRLASAAHTQLADDVRDVDARGLGADEQLVGDLGVGAPGGHKPEDLELAVGQAERLDRRLGGALVR